MTSGNGFGTYGRGICDQVSVAATADSAAEPLTIYGRLAHLIATTSPLHSLDINTYADGFIVGSSLQETDPDTGRARVSRARTASFVSALQESAGKENRR